MTDQAGYTLTLDAALSGCSVGVVGPEGVVSEAGQAGRRGHAAALPEMARAVMQRAGSGTFSTVVVTTGPGSFTGLRAALALAHGIGLGAGISVVGVTVGEALAAQAPPGRDVWAAIDTRRGRVFLERHGQVESFALDSLPDPSGSVAIVGDAAIAVASRLAARGADVLLMDARRPSPAGIAAAAAKRQASGQPPRPAQPLYVDPPEARPGPATRPAPG